MGTRAYHPLLLGIAPLQHQHTGVISAEEGDSLLHQDPLNHTTIPGPGNEGGHTAKRPWTSRSRESAVISLKTIANWDGTSREINQALTAAFEAHDYWDCIRNLVALEIDPQLYIDSLDQVCSYPIPEYHAWSITIWRQIIDSLPPDSKLRKRYTLALRKACGLYGTLPASCTTTFGRSKPGQRVFESGGCSDVWRSAGKKGRDPVFAVKTLRVYGQDPDKVWRLPIRNWYKGLTGDSPSRNTARKLWFAGEQIIQTRYLSKWRQSCSGFAWSPSGCRTGIFWATRGKPQPSIAWNWWVSIVVRRSESVFIES